LSLAASSCIPTFFQQNYAFTTAKFGAPVFLYWISEDSSVLLHLARVATRMPGEIPW
jgi:hypothetical protein